MNAFLQSASKHLMKTFPLTVSILLLDRTLVSLEAVDKCPLNISHMQSLYAVKRRAHA
jgi:hypothetical protein